MIVEVSAPSNIALIKYMGKIDSVGNIPTNSSLSWTLNELQTFVRISLREDFVQDQWQPLTRPGLDQVHLNEVSIQRFLNHFKSIKKEWKIEKYFLVESANNFPSDCGLASSASSFAALTKGAVEIFQKFSLRSGIGLVEMAELSRRGSGSSCRSFFHPWALWDKDGVRALEFSSPSLLHQVVVVTDKKKLVSSSEAHRRVSSSPLFKDRVERAEQRLTEIIHALKNQNWRALHKTSWDEFLDMHSLFETSVPPFSYLETASQEILDSAKALWDSSGDGPVVTMDAGANVHFLWRPDQLDQAKKLTQKFANKYRVVSCKEIREVLEV